MAENGIDAAINTAVQPITEAFSRIVFYPITLFGTGDPKLMAGGISQALVTTVLGLCVAIPTVLLHTIVASRARRLNQVLEEQTAGMVAAQSEAQHAKAA